MSELGEAEADRGSIQGMLFRKNLQGVREAEREGKGPVVNVLSCKVQLGPDPQLAWEHKLHSRSSNLAVRMGSLL